MEYQKITNLFGNIPDREPRVITKKWIKAHDQSVTAENRYKPSKQIRFKTSMLRPDLYLVRHIFMLQEKLQLQVQTMMHITKN